MKSYQEFLSENINYPFVRVEKNPHTLVKSIGESGYGIYFSLTRYPQMLKYYKDEKFGHDVRIIYARPKINCEIYDFTKSENLDDLIQYMKNEIDELSKRMSGYMKPKINRSNYQRFGNIIENYIRDNKLDISGYIVNHEFYGSIPKGKQLIITKEDDFEYYQFT